MTSGMAIENAKLFIQGGGNSPKTLAADETVKADRHEATLPRNYCMQPCYATYAMSNHDVKRLHGKRCTPRLRGKVAPCLSALRSIEGGVRQIERTN